MEGRWQLVLCGGALRLRRGFFICLQHSLCGHGRVAFIWRRSGDDGSLGSAQRRTVACNPSHRACPGRKWTCRTPAPGTLGSIAEWFDPDAGSWRGLGKNPVRATAGNFLRAVPLAVAVSIVMLPWARLDRTGIVYAVISGAITSGLGYVIWYSALPGLKAAGAATVQLSVPVLAATGGILLLGEPITFRYFVASIAVLGGIALVIIEKNSA